LSIAVTIFPTDNRHDTCAPPVLKDGKITETIEEYKCDTCGRVFEVVNIVFKEKKGDEIKVFK
jgi:hypothetical protein